MRSGGGFARVVREAVGRGETVFGDLNGARGAGDVLEINDEGVEQGLLADARGQLSGLGLVELHHERIKSGEVRSGTTPTATGTIPEADAPASGVFITRPGFGSHGREPNKHTANLRPEKN